MGAACPVAPSPGFGNVGWYMSQPGAFTLLRLPFHTCAGSTVEPSTSLINTFLFIDTL